MKPASVILWGKNEHLSDYILFLNEANIQVKFIVDIETQADSLENIKVVSIRWYFQNYREFKYIPIVVLEGNGTDFVDSVENILKYIECKDIKFLHPSFLAAHINLDLSNRALVLGCNRSGSTLLFSVIKHILDNKSDYQFGKKEKLMATLSEEHVVSFKRYFDNIFCQGNNAFSTINSTKFRTCDYYGGWEKVFFYISSFDANRFVFDRVHRTYSILDESTIEFCKKYNYKIFVPIRNPLDIIVSNAFEIENILFHMYPAEIPDEAESDFKTNYGLNHLKNLEWFCSISEIVKAYLEAYLKYEKELVAIKYENMISNPKVYISQLAEYFDIDVDDAYIDSLWNEIAFKPLASHKAHMFRPGKDKWKLFLTRDHMNILKKMNYHYLTNKLGYFIDYEYGCNANIYKGLNRSRIIDSALAIRDKIFQLQFNKPINHFDNSISCANKIKQKIDIKFATNNKESLEMFNAVSETSQFSKVLMALSS